jgi:hypothetical protein
MASKRRRDKISSLSLQGQASKKLANCQMTIMVAVVVTKDNPLVVTSNNE